MRPLTRLDIVTRNPDKWKVIDTETKEVWVWSTENRWRREGYCPSIPISSERPSVSPSGDVPSPTICTSTPSRS
jgi:hypothetical protein